MILLLFTTGLFLILLYFLNIWYNYFRFRIVEMLTVVNCKLDMIDLLIWYCWALLKNMIFFIRLHLGYFGFLLYFHVNLLFRTAGNSTLQQFLLLRVVYGGDCDNLILGIVCWDILSLLLLEECGLHCLLAGISLLLGYTLCGLLSNYILINLFEIITIFLIHLMTADVSCKGLDLSDLFLCAINLCQIAFGIGHFISIKYLWRILMDITICIY